MAAVLAIAGLGWQRLWRDPLGLAFTFLAPIAVASVLVGIYTSQDPTDGYPLGVVVLDDQGAVGRDLLRRFETNPVLEIERYDTRAGVERAVRRRDVAAAVVVPREVEAQGDQPAVVELVGPPQVALPSGVRAAVESDVAETAASIQLGRALFPEANRAGAVVAGQVVLAQVEGPSPATASADRSWSVAEVAVLGTLVLFMGMNTMAGSSLLAELRELGIVARLRTTRARTRVVGLGLTLGFASYALVVGGLMLGTGRLVFGATWAAWPALLGVLVVVALAIGGLALLTGTVLPSAESGTTIAGPAGFTLGMVGGCLWPLQMVGPALERLGHLTPHAWAVEALQITGIGGGGLDDVASQLGVLASFAAGCFLLGTWRLARIDARA